MDISTSSAYAGVDPGQTPHMLAYVAKGSPIGVNTIRSFLTLSPYSLECPGNGQRCTSPESQAWTLAIGDPRSEYRVKLGFVE